MAKITFSDEEWDVFCNIVSGIESGGNCYGNADWGDFTEAYTNTSNEKSVTCGSFQFYGVEAHQVVQLIKDKYPSTFNKYDNAGIASDLKASDWSHYQISKSSAKAKAIVKMISSPEGIKAQKEIFKTNSQGLLEYAYSLGVTDHKALAMAMQIAHLGGKSALKRIIDKTSKPYTVSSIDAALRTDNQNSSQVGAKIFRERHDCVIKWLDKYWPTNSSSSSSKPSSDNNSKSTGGKTMGKTYPAGYISNSGHDENNTYHGGKSGDQSGSEWEIKPWYDRNWNVVLRYPDAKVRHTIAQLAVEAALNNKIGYDQYERTTFWYQLAKVGYRPSKITTACEADCSAGVTAICKAAGYLHNISGLKNLDPDNYTGSMKSSFREAGFEVLTASKYLTSSDYILAGDVLLNEGRHTCTVVSSGAKSGESPVAYEIDGSIDTSGSSSSSSSGSLNETVKSYVYVNVAQTALRSWAGKSNSKLKSYPTVVKGQKLGYCDTVKADDGSTWYFIKIQDKYGFIDANDVSKNEPTASTTADKTDSSSSSSKQTITICGERMSISDGKTFNTKKRKWIGLVTASKLALRQWAGTDSPKLTSLPDIKKGNKVYVYDVLLDNEGAPWLYVKVKNPTTGVYVWAFCYAGYIEKI